VVIPPSLEIRGRYRARLCWVERTGFGFYLKEAKIDFVKKRISFFDSCQILFFDKSDLTQFLFLTSQIGQFFFQQVVKGKGKSPQKDIHSPRALKRTQRSTATMTYGGGCDLVGIEDEWDGGMAAMRMLPPSQVPPRANPGPPLLAAATPCQSGPTPAGGGGVPLLLAAGRPVRSPL
jgi:hypothetical protein